MEGLEKLKEMAKNGEISSKLLGDEEFKNGFKSILKKEGNVEFTDERISKIIKNLETSLQDEKLIKKAEEKLENVSGGSLASKAVKGTSMLVGALIGFKAGQKAGSGISKPIVKQDLSKKLEGKSTHEKLRIINNAHRDIDIMGTPIAISGYTAGLGTAGGLYLGNRIGKYICDKLNIKD